jgi:hypothetical protein
MLNYLGILGVKIFTGSAAPVVAVSHVPVLPLNGRFAERNYFILALKAWLDWTVIRI